MMLDEASREQLRKVLSSFAGDIERAAVFGSRATGRARDNSDIDLVLYGSMTQESVDRLWTLLEESDLPVTVDVVVYSSDLYAPLKRHIDVCAITLFSRDDLLPAQSVQAA